MSNIFYYISFIYFITVLLSTNVINPGIYKLKLM